MKISKDLKDKILLLSETLKPVIIADRLRETGITKKQISDIIFRNKSNFFGWYEMMCKKDAFAINSISFVRVEDGGISQDCSLKKGKFIYIMSFGNMEIRAKTPRELIKEYYKLKSLLHKERSK